MPIITNNNSIIRTNRRTIAHIIVNGGYWLRGLLRIGPTSIPIMEHARCQSISTVLVSALNSRVAIGIWTFKFESSMFRTLGSQHVNSA